MNLAARKYFLIMAAAFFSIFLLVVFQVSFLGRFFFYSAVPNLIYILVFALYITLDTRVSLFTAFFAGLLYDILTLGTVGLTPLSFLLSLLIFSFIRRFFSHSFYLFLLYFYLSSVLLKSLAAFRLERSLFALGSLDLLVLLLMIGVLRWLISIFGSSSVIQLRFKELR